MSIALMARVWDTECASHTQKLVLLALADNANDAGVCWPSVNTIASKCQLSRRSVQYEIRRLVDTGMVQVRIQHGRNKSNTYHLTIEKRASGAPFTGKRANHDIENVQITTLKGARHAPKPSGTIIEPSGGRESPRIFPKELIELQKLATEKIKALKEAYSDGNGHWTNESKRTEYQDWIKKRKEWEQNLLAM